MCMETVKRGGGARLLLKKPFPEPLNEEDIRRLAEEAKRRGG